MAQVTIYYKIADEWPALMGDPFVLPRDRVMMVEHGRQRLASPFEHYVWHAEFEEWWGVYCRCVAQEFRDRGFPVFNGIGVPVKEYGDFLRSLKPIQRITES